MKLPENALIQVTKQGQVSDLFTHDLVSYGYLQNSSLRAPRASDSTHPNIVAATYAAPSEADSKTETASNEGEKKEVYIYIYIYVYCLGAFRKQLCLKLLRPICF